MTERLSAATTLMSALWPRVKGPALPRAALLAAVGVALLTLSAKISVPFYPVPMTMQTFVVLVIGAAYGWRLGAATVALYLLVGALGMPVFADTPARGIGLPYMLGSTGGYLVGFVVAAAAVGWLAARGWDRGLLRLVVMMSLGHALIFAFGMAWLARHIGVDRAWALGVAPFYAASVFKTALAVAALRAGWWLKTRGA